MKFKCAVAPAGKKGLFKMCLTHDANALILQLSGAVEYTCIFFGSFPDVVGLCGVDLRNGKNNINHTVERCGGNSWGELPLGPVVIVGAPNPNTGDFTDLPQSFIDEMPFEAE